MLFKYIPSAQSASWTGTPLGQIPVVSKEEFRPSVAGIRLQACSPLSGVYPLNKAENGKGRHHLGFELQPSRCIRYKIEGIGLEIL